MLLAEEVATWKTGVFYRGFPLSLHQQEYNSWACPTPGGVTADLTVLVRSAGPPPAWPPLRARRWSRAC